MAKYTFASWSRTRTAMAGAAIVHAGRLAWRGSAGAVPPAGHRGAPQAAPRRRRRARSWSSPPSAARRRRRARAARGLLASAQSPRSMANKAELGLAHDERVGVLVPRHDGVLVGARSLRCRPRERGPHRGCRAPDRAMGSTAARLRPRSLRLPVLAPVRPRTCRSAAWRGRMRTRRCRPEGRDRTSRRRRTRPIAPLRQAARSSRTPSRPGRRGAGTARWPRRRPPRASGTPCWCGRSVRLQDERASTGCAQRSRSAVFSRCSSADAGDPLASYQSAALEVELGDQVRLDPAQLAQEELTEEGVVAEPVAPSVQRNQEVAGGLETVQAILRIGTSYHGITQRRAERSSTAVRRRNC